MNYRPEIDGLRAIAVLPVILFHMGLQSWAGGFLGVDVFFVISGFLISSILIKQIETGRFSFIDFYARRFRRILPILYCVLACTLVAGSLILLPSQYEFLGKSILSILGFASNILFWRSSGYFGESSEENPLLHTWSLSIEEQFYLLAPALLMLFISQAPRHLKIIIWLFAIASFGLSIIATSIAPSASFFLLPTRAWELLAGTLCAVHMKEGKAIKSSETLAVIGLTLLIMSFLILDSTTPLPSYPTLIPVIGTVLILRYATIDTLVGRVLSSKYFRLIGLISYSLYLWHQPAFAFARLTYTGDSLTSLLGLIAVACIPLSYLSWRFIETPCRHGTFKPFADNRRTYITTALTSAVLFIGGTVPILSEGLPQRLNPTDLQMRYQNTMSFSPERERCHTSGNDFLGPQQSCVFPNDNASPPTIAVFGDSHGVELSYALGYQLNHRTRQLTFSGCRPTLSLNESPNGCGQWSRESLRWLQSEASIATVILTYRLDAYFQTTDTPSFDRMAEALAEITQGLITADKRVILMLPIPTLPESMEHLIFSHRNDSLDIPGRSRESFQQRTQAKAIEELTRRLPKEVEIWDTTLHLCSETVCFAGKDGTSLYWDDNHISVAGAEMVLGSLRLR